MNVKGLDQAKAFNTKLAERLKKKKQEMKPIIDKVFRESQEVVPRDTEELARSGSVVETPTGYKIQYTAGHAERIHEDLTMHHGPGEKSKYVERPNLAHEAELNKKMNEFK